MMTALMCALGPLTIPVGPVPLSLATLGVCLSGALLGAKRGVLATALYLAIGAMGVPVFAGFSAGIQRLAGPTGGYLLGYLPCAAAVGLAVQRNLPLKPAMALGMFACYGLGTAWFMAQTGAGFSGAMAVCVLPFLPGDVLKICAADAAAKAMKKGPAFR